MEAMYFNGIKKYLFGLLVFTNGSKMDPLVSGKGLFACKKAPENFNCSMRL